MVDRESTPLLEATRLEAYLKDELEVTGNSPLWVAALPAPEVARFANLLEHRTELAEVGARAFEQLVAELLKADGFDEVQLIPRINAAGPDIIACCSLPEGREQTFIVECKAWKGTVGIDTVRSFVYRMDYEYPESQGLLVTTSRFTRDAKAAVEKLHKWRLTLKDRRELEVWIKRYASSLNLRRSTPEWRARGTIEEQLQACSLRTDLVVGGLGTALRRGPDLSLAKERCPECGSDTVVCGRGSAGEYLIDTMYLVVDLYCYFHICPSCLDYASIVSESSFPMCPFCFGSRADGTRLR